MLSNYTEVKSKSGHESLNTKDAAMIALCAAVMAVCSWISIPAAVPFTMQTFGVFLAVGLLGGRNGTLAVLIYILLGAAGLPLMWLVEALLGRGSMTLVASMIAGLLICYAFGTAWFMVVYARDSGSVGLITALSWCVFPYIIPDALKILLAAGMTRRLRPLIMN